LSNNNTDPNVIVNENFIDEESDNLSIDVSDNWSIDVIEELDVCAGEMIQQDC
jgi:hypothetical protein